MSDIPSFVEHAYSGLLTAGCSSYIKINHYKPAQVQIVFYVVVYAAQLYLVHKLADALTSNIFYLM